MNKQEAYERFQKIQKDYNSIKYPKYRNTNIEHLKKQYSLLIDVKEFLKENCLYIRLINSISQTITRLSRTSTWRNVSERGINKAIRPLMKTGNKEIEYPFEWQDDKFNQNCFISNGTWGPKNYTVMDVIGYFFLLKEGGDALPYIEPPIFDDLDSIEVRETELNQPLKPSSSDIDQSSITGSDLDLIKRSRHWLKFNDADFRRFTSLKMNSNDIRQLLLDTSRVEFKLVFPVRLKDGKNKFKERPYIMNLYSRLFELAYIDKIVRTDGVIKNREYYVVFNTMLGELFVNNLKTHNFDWLGNNFYSLPLSAQLLYRRLLLHHNHTVIPLKLDTIKERLNLRDDNITNLVGTIEVNALEPLRKYGFITSYKKEKGLSGIKYIISKPSKTTDESKSISANTESCKEGYVKLVGGVRKTYRSGS